MHVRSSTSGLRPGLRQLDEFSVNRLRRHRFLLLNLKSKAGARVQALKRRSHRLACAAIRAGPSIRKSRATVRSITSKVAGMLQRRPLVFEPSKEFLSLKAIATRAELFAGLSRNQALNSTCSVGERVAAAIVGLSGRKWSTTMRKSETTEAKAAEMMGLLMEADATLKARHEVWA